MRIFVKYTNPILKLFSPITPGFLIEALVPLYVAWFFYIIRFYLMPWLLGYSYWGCFPSRWKVTSPVVWRT